MLLGMLAMSEAASAADILRGCYTARFSEASGQISAVRLSIPEAFAAGDPEDEAPFLTGAVLSASLHSKRGPDMVDAGMGCSVDETVVSCFIDCDGGRASWQSIGEDLILLRAGIAMATGSDSLVLTQEPTGRATVLEGTFVLKAADPLQCEGDTRTEALAPLSPGTLAPAVKRAEAALQTLGFFSGTPDWVFDGDSADALSAFQGAVGLVPTGILDEATEEKLSVYAVLSAGC
jgi:hypothetical protein